MRFSEEVPHEEIAPNLSGQGSVNFNKGGGTARPHLICAQKEKVGTRYVFSVGPPARSTGFRPATGVWTFCRRHWPSFVGNFVGLLVYAVTAMLTHRMLKVYEKALALALAADAEELS